jgi:hypothetical protein
VHSLTCTVSLSTALGSTKLQDIINNTAAITVTAANKPDRIITARLFLEEHQLDAPADAFCYTLVVANGKEVPTSISGQISGLVLPASSKPDIHGAGCNGTATGCWPLQRIFNANYAVNLTHDAASGNWSFDDFIDATATNVYRLGCYVHDHNCTTVTDSKTPGGLVRPGHPFAKSSCLVLNGGFEFTSLSQGANNGLSLPGRLGDMCCASWGPAYRSRGCCADNDDRTHITACAADPKSGRYSMKLIIPTVLPVWMPVPVTKNAPGPLANGTTYVFTLWARSSPIGAKIYFLVGPAATSNSTVGLTLLGTANRTWGKMSVSFAMPSTVPSAGFAATEPPGVQLMLAPAALPKCGGCKALGASVWLDDVAIVQATDDGQ